MLTDPDSLPIRISIIILLIAVHGLFAAINTALSTSSRITEKYQTTNRLIMIVCTAFSAWIAFYGITVILSPLTKLLIIITNLLLRLFQQETHVEEEAFSEEEVMSMLEAGQESGVLKEEGKKMINSIFAFDDKLAYEVMTPRTDVFMIDLEDPVEEYFDDLMTLRHSRIPVGIGESDNIIGILHIND